MHSRFIPATPANPRVAAIMEYCACTDWLENVYGGNVHNDAADYVAAWEAEKLDRYATLRDIDLVAEYMRGQLVAYAYALDMGIA